MRNKNEWMNEWMNGEFMRGMEKRGKKDMKRDFCVCEFLVLTLVLLVFDRWDLVELINRIFYLWNEDNIVIIVYGSNESLILYIEFLE